MNLTFMHDLEATDPVHKWADPRGWVNGLIDPRPESEELAQELNGRPALVALEMDSGQGVKQA